MEVETLCRKWYFADCIEGLFINRAREFHTRSMPESRRIFRKRQKAGDMPGTAVGNTNIPTNQLNGAYVDRLLQVAQQMIAVQSAFASYLRRMKDLVGTTTELSLAAFRRVGSPREKPTFFLLLIVARHVQLTTTMLSDLREVPRLQSLFVRSVNTIFIDNRSTICNRYSVCMEYPSSMDWLRL